jgi:Transposase IS66 family
MTEAEPVLDRIGARLAELKQRALPKSALGKAVWYASNQWQALRRYTEDGRLTIDNNVSERTLRHQAIGRKTGCSWAASKLGLGRPSCSRSSRAPSVTASNRGPTSASCSYDCTTTIHVSTRCSLTNGPPITLNPSSPTGSTNPAAKRLRGIVADVTHES